MGPGSADSAKVPYYLLIVGSPEEIPYRFQSQLDVQYAVGRIHFDSIEQYANYARSVVAAETGQVVRPKRAALFGVSNPDDRATTTSTEQIFVPLQQQLQTSQTEWQIDAYLGDAATKARLTSVLGGDGTPAFLFSGSQGMSFGIDNPVQEAHQGALLCQDWPGPEAWREPIPHDVYFDGNGQ